MFRRTHRQAHSHRGRTGGGGNHHSGRVDAGPASLCAASAISWVTDWPGRCTMNARRYDMGLTDQRERRRDLGNAQSGAADERDWRAERDAGWLPRRVEGRNRPSAGGAGTVEAPIAGYPNFEHLEAEGQRPPPEQLKTMLKARARSSLLRRAMSEGRAGARAAPARRHFEGRDGNGPQPHALGLYGVRQASPSPEKPIRAARKAAAGRAGRNHQLLPPGTMIAAPVAASVGQSQCPTYRGAGGVRLLAKFRPSAAAKDTTKISARGTSQMVFFGEGDGMKA